MVDSGCRIVGIQQRRSTREDGFFSRFAHADADGRTSDGIGLGLAIVKLIMRLHNGVVTVDSTRSETRFMWSFPPALPDARATIVA